MRPSLWIRACAAGAALSIVACAPTGDRAQLPRQIVSPQTVAAGVFDLETLSQRDVDAWSSALDPQGLYFQRVDDLYWSLQRLQQVGVRKLLLLTEAGDSTQPTQALLLQSRSGADPSVLLAELWETARWMGSPWRSDQVALLGWQEDWWLVEAPGLHLPEIQALEHGAALQESLAQHVRSPVRAAFQIAGASRERMHSLRASGWPALLLGPLSQPLLSMRGGSLALDHQGPSPRVRLTLELDSPEDARLTQEFGAGGLQALRTSLEDFALGLARWGTPLKEQSGALERVFETLTIHRDGRFVSLTLDRHFFGALRHLRNLQTQPARSAPTAAAWLGGNPGRIAHPTQ